MICGTKGLCILVVFLVMSERHGLGWELHIGSFLTARLFRALTCMLDRQDRTDNVSLRELHQSTR
jgi:hypothetical protein